MEELNGSDMKTLIVYYHPHEGSFCSAIRDAVENGLHKGGHECKTIDLDKAGFDPVMREKDLAAFVAAGRMGEDGLDGVDPVVLRFMKKLRWAERIVMIFPIWWMTMPAMVKGFVDKVIFPGIVYKMENGRLVSQLSSLKDIIVITTTGAGIMSLTNIKSTYTTNPNGNTSTVPTAPTEAPSETPSEDPAATPSGTFEVKVAVGSSAKTLAASEPASESVLTSIYMTRGAAELVVASMNAPAEEEIPEETEPEVFEPETFEVKLNKKTANVGDKITVKVTTSTEVSYVTVNGQKITKNKIDKKKGTRTWEISLKAEQAGTMEVEVVAYNEEDLASNPAEQIVTVTEKSSKK